MTQSAKHKHKFASDGGLRTGLLKPIHQKGMHGISVCDLDLDMKGVSYILQI